MERTYRIGLTGGIASGKSAVAQILAEVHRIPVLDADRFARDVLAPGSEATDAVLRHYGHSVRTSHPATHLPSVDRAALARLVFSDPSERRWLEALVHPLVRQRIETCLGRLRDEPVVVLMIPLLFEAGFDSLCDLIWVVDCGTEPEQRRRLIRRDGLTEQQAHQRMAAQWPMALKIARADVVIDNQGSLEELKANVHQALAASWPPRAFND